MNVVPFPRRGLTVHEMFARNHRDPAQWGISAAAAGAAAMAGICAGSFWVAGGVLKTDHGLNSITMTCTRCDHRYRAAWD